VCTASVLLVAVAGLAACGSSAAPRSLAKATTSSAPRAAANNCKTTQPMQQGNGKQYSSPPPMTIDPTKTYTATFDTSCGTFIAALDAKTAPKGVNNFVFLARTGFYNGLTFHRAVTNFVIQGGDPKGDGSGGPGYGVVTETPRDGYRDGDLAWAKTEADAPGTAGSQFFVVTGDASGLDASKQGSVYAYGDFGHLTSGFAVAKAIEHLAPASGDGEPIQPVYIYSVTITEH
jgi:peptidylprolyl isomerase